LDGFAPNRLEAFAKRTKNLKGRPDVRPRAAYGTQDKVIESLKIVRQVAVLEI
jgi:hypothetical protein